MKLDRIEESSSSVRLLGGRSKSSSDGASSESRWVDGSEVDWDEAPPWSNKNDNHGSDGGREGYGSNSIRRRLIKKPKRVDSFDVQAMQIAASHDQHSKVCFLYYFFL